jgi:hypothetical protein
MVFVRPPRRILPPGKPSRELCIQSARPLPPLNPSAINAAARPIVIFARRNASVRPAEWFPSIGQSISQFIDIPMLLRDSMGAAPMDNAAKTTQPFGDSYWRGLQRDRLYRVALEISQEGEEAFTLNPLLVAVLIEVLKILIDRCLKLRISKVNQPNALERWYLWRYTKMAVRTQAGYADLPYDYETALEAYNKLLRRGEKASELEVSKLLNA